MIKPRRFNRSPQRIRYLVWTMALVVCVCLIADCSPSALTSRTTKTITPALSASGESRISIPECVGDEQAPKLSPGWKLVWQHTFDAALALPPIIDGSQVALLERADPIPNLYKDTVWMLDAATSAVQWHFDSSVALNLTDHWIELTAWSPKYFAIVVNDSHAPRQFVIVFDRTTGQIIYQTELQALEFAITDEALFYRSGERRLYRIDLPSGQQRWKDSRTDYIWQGLYSSEKWLYAFIGVISTQNSLNILKYDADSGALVNSIEANPVSEVIASDSRAVGRANSGYIALYDLSTLASTWQTNFEGRYPAMKDSNAFFDNPSRITLTQDAVYLFDAQHSLVKIALADGKIMWTVPFADAEPMSKPAALAGIVYGFFSDGTVRAFSEVDGSLLVVRLKSLST